MSDDKILFLSFLSIFDYFEVAFVRVTYQELVGELNLKCAGEFDSILNWFKDDKIDIVDEHIRFSHPSYSEALEHLLVEDGRITRINKEIFSKLLLKLSEKFRGIAGVVFTVTKNFDKFPDNVRDLLFKFAEKSLTAWYVAWAVGYNYDKLPETVRHDLLLKLSEKSKADVAATMAEADDFDKHTDDVRDLLLKLSDILGAARYVAYTVADNFDIIPDNIRTKLLFRLSEKDEAAKVVAQVVANNFDSLPDDVRNLLDRLQKPLQQVIEDLSSSEERRDQEEALRLISNTLSKLDLNFVLKTLNDLSKSRNENVRTEAAKLLKTVSGDSDGDK